MKKIKISNKHANNQSLYSLLAVLDKYTLKNKKQRQADIFFFIYIK